MPNIKLSSKQARGKLKTRHEPYWLEIDRGFHLGYRRGKSSGVWYVRRYLSNRYTKRRLGLADDNQTADDESVLSYTQARKKAANYEDLMGYVEPQRQTGPYSVADAVDDYLRWYRLHSKALKETQGVCEYHILPKLGRIPTTRLTKQQIDSWLEQIATSPPRSKHGKVRPPYAVKMPTGELNRVGNQKFDYRPLPFEKWTDEMQRRRKSTANRVLTVLKATLNHAWKNGKVKDPGAWQRVGRYKNADAARVKYLTETEASKLLQSASDDFRPIARAALLTGCRYGELCRLQVSDFADGQIFIEKEKSDKPRHVPLSDHGIKFFKALAKDKSRNDLLLTHQDGSNWDRSHQTRPMRQACEKAGINPPVGFHVLRHSYATLLLRSDGSQGVSIRYVAALIGDSVATCEKHYGHVIQNDLRKEVARKLPSFGDT